MSPLKHDIDAESGVHLWLSAELSSEDADELKRSFVRMLDASDGSDVSAGRGSMRFVKTPGGNEAALRGFRRGGFVRRIFRSSYVRVWPGLERLRPVAELRVLERLKSAGVSVSAGIGAAAKLSCGGLLYQAVIATERISGTTLQEAASNLGTDKLYGLSFDAGKQALAMLRTAVFHPDLHPANVMVSAEGSVVLIDFDKAAVHSHSLVATHREALFARWDRAVAKRGLPAEIRAGFRAGLDAD